MRVFKTKPFCRFAERESIDDAALCEAVRRAEAGLVDADLGGGVVKQRIARKGSGKSRGYRVILLLHKSERCFFVYRFAKRDRTNIRRNELAAFRMLAEQLLRLEDAALSESMATGTIVEVLCNGRAVR